MNPIDKITDPSFTNTSKGLLTLFCIGIAHTVIGVDLTSTEIAIPWLPSINFPNPERIFFLYWGLVSFAMYRYTLHHLHIIKKGYCNALVIFLKSGTSGKKFIDTKIFSDKINHQVKFEHEPENPPKIKIEHYTYDGDPEVPTHEDKGWEIAANVEFIFNQEFTLERITFSENPSYDFEEMALKSSAMREKWGLKEFIYDDQTSLFSAPKIKSFWLRNQLRFSVLRCYIKVLASSKDAFDLLIPLVLNASLLAYWTIGLLLKA